MAARVLATEKARAAAEQFGALLDGDVHTALVRVRQQGQVLTNPAVWNGPRAAAFREREWPPVKTAIDHALQVLQRLHTSAAQVIDEILKAGDGAIEGKSGAGDGKPPEQQDGPLQFLEKTLLNPYEDAHRAVEASLAAVKTAGLQLVRDSEIVATEEMSMLRVEGGMLFGYAARTAVAVGYRNARIGKEAWEKAPLVESKVKGVASETAGIMTREGGVVLSEAKGSFTDALNLAKGAEFTGKWIAGPLAIPLAAWEQYQEDANDTHLTAGQRITRLVAAGILEGGGAWGGSELGQWAGGAIGGMAGGGATVETGPGAVAGAGAGAVVGAAVGSVLGGVGGQFVGHAIKQRAFAWNPDHVFGD